ncbi:amino acid adenylation domain-containing protein [Kitasatospora sp. NPDC092039]|uniref:amino acid adenylation domain-containing protein n=1 Tax=Kitasatospora sp. NPDC092039 TaxID=3364086 RepID=UPI00380DE421
MTEPTTAPDRREQLRELLLARARQAAALQDVAAGQRALWLFDQLHPGSPAYHLSGAARIDGPFDPARMRDAFQRVLDRHPALRTTLVQEDGELRQKVNAALAADFTETDLTGRAPHEVDAAVTAFTERPFDLAAGPMLRAQVARLDDDAHLLVLTAHHVATDLWSFGLIADDLRRCYAGEPLAGRPAAGYLDFVRHQRQWLAGPQAEAAAAYWRRQLAGEVPRLDLPLDRARPARPSHRAAAYSFVLDRELTAALKETARAAGATPYVALLSVFNVLLHRYTGQRDLWLGTATSNRNQAAFQEVVGYFANMMTVRTAVAPGCTFRDLLGQVRATVLDGMEHQDLPFPLVVRQTAEGRGDGSTTLYDVVFHYETAPWSAQRGLSLLGTGFTDTRIPLGDVELRPYEVPTHGSEHDLALFVEEIDGVSYCSLRYSVDLFERATVARMAEHLATLARGCATEPDRDVGLLPMLSGAERKQVLVGWNRPDDGQAAPGSCIHHLVAAQAGRTPDRIAVVGADRTLTYRQLIDEAERLAVVLRGHGVRPEVRVGISVDGRADLMVAMLAVLTAGGAYLPLDPGYPVKRLEYMLADADVALLLTHRELLERLPVGELPVLLLDEEHPLPDPAPEPVEPTADNLAYIIYTSGSTGRPKGVLVEHRGVVDLDLAHREGFAPDPDRRILQNSSISFDVSTWEWVMALTTGAALHLAPRARLRPGPPLIETVRSRGITAIAATPAVLATMDPADLPTVTEITSVGEAISAEVVRTWADGRRIVNAYGPTEITVFCTLETCVPDGRTPAVGRPVAATELYVLDENLEPVPVGVVGELYLGGSGVTRGYQNRPDLTADRFVPHPYTDVPGARLYRTGDRVRLDEDGRLRYLGRNDHQVKIRGVRTEPGEVQAVLTDHPGVREAVVMARPAPGGGLRLLGWVVPNRSYAPAVTAAGLRDHLAERLMPNMVPSFITVMEAFPLNPNGKVDRGELPEPELGPAEGPTGTGLPATATERRIAGLWCEVLGLPAVGAEDNFFDLGGHSLLAAQLVARIRDAHGSGVQLHEVFDTPTVRGLAALLDARGAGADGARPGEIARLARDGNGLPLSFAQQRLWFMEQLRPGDQAYRLCGELRLDGPVDAGVLRAAMAEVVRRHEALRTVYRVVDGGPRQFVVDAPADPLPLTDLSTLPEVERDRELARIRAEFDTEPFDLTDSPARSRLVRLAPGRHVALLAVHHIAADGWSMRVLVRELVALYRAFAAGDDSPLPAPAVQYADFAAWQRERQEGEEGAAGLDYWTERLAGGPPAIDLPTDRPHREGAERRAGRARRLLGAELLGRLEELARAERATLSMTLLAAFDVLLARWSGQDDVLVGMPVAGRSRTDLEGTVGLFVNTVVVRTDLSGGPTFRQLLGRVKESALGADAHQDVPFERIVERLAPARDLARTPVFQVVFNMINLAPLDAEIPGVEVRLVEAEDVTPRFELTLYAKPEGDDLALDLVYDASLFTAATAEEQLGQLGLLLAQVAADPGLPVAALPAAPAGSDEVADAVGTETAEAPAHAAFLRTAAERPRAVALVGPDGELDYAELAERSAALAARLRAGGVGPGARVAVHAARRTELVVALLAVLRSGAAFAVLDRAHPRARLTACAELLGATAWLDATGAAGPPEVLGPPVALALTAAPDGAPAAPQGPERHGEEAYIAFTSGSTGTPKAVRGGHRPLTHFVDWCTTAFGLGPDDRFALTSGLGHDPLLRDLLVPLSVGARLCVPDETVQQDPRTFARWLADHAVTVLHLTPPTARFLAAAEVQLPALRHVFFGGDRLTGHEVALVRRLAPNARVAGFYGATETPQAPVFHVVDGPVEADRPLPLGRAVPGMRVAVERPDGSPAAVNELGEIVVRGPHLALGYLDDERATAARFTGSGADRGYRTGDLGRIGPDGELRFAGRADRQLKIRGHRVEPAETEAVLREHPAVTAALVTAVRDGLGEQVLTAYVTTADGGADEAALRAHTAARLPGHQVPARIAPVARFPLTPNGKVDLDRLAAGTAPAAPAGLAPAPGAETALTALWARLLGLDPARIGRESTFFDLGGHSLLMVALQQALRAEFGRDLPVVELFRHPTVAALAAVLEQGAAPAAAPGADEAGPSADERARKRADRRRRLKQGHRDA